MMEMDQETIQGICEGRSSRPRYPGGRGVLDTETRQDKRDAAAENLRGHTFGPVTTTKNPKKLRKQKAMGEIEENFELWVNGLVEEGYNLSDYTWDEMYEFYLEEGRTTNLRALAGESERGRPETQDEKHRRLAMGRYSPSQYKWKKVDGQWKNMGRKDGEKD